MREETMSAGGSLSPIGDVDGDGRTDAARATLDCKHKTLHVSVLESSRHAQPREIGTVNVACTWPTCVFDLGDLDQDGVHDLAVIALDHAIQVFSVRTGRSLFAREVEWNVFDGDTGFGQGVAAFVDGASVAHLLIGADERHVLDGEIEHWSLAEPTLMTTISPPPNYEEWHFGANIELLDDLDGDGLPDMKCVPNHTMCGVPGAIHVVSTRTGQRIWSAVSVATSHEIQR
jgi:hypothetical protein